MKILVTGSTGYVGRTLIPTLLSQKHQILELTRNLEVSNKLFGKETSKYLVDANQEELKNAIQLFMPDAVVHLAAYITSDDSYTSLINLIETNILYFCRILDSVKDLHIKIFINTGTFAEYANGDFNMVPAYLYAASKSASHSLLDYYARTYNFKQIKVVPFSIYGGDSKSKKALDIIYDSLNSQNPTHLSPGNQILDFIHIDDVIGFYQLLINNHNMIKNGSTFQLGTGKGYSLRHLASLMEEVSGGKTNIIWGGIPYRKTDIMYAVAERFDYEQLGWRPSIDLREGLKRYIAERSRSQGFC